MSKEITRIDKTTKWSYHVKKVGVYCRVSSSSSGQLHSLADQASGLTRYVYRQPMMMVADILDVASGSDVVNRPEFQRLLQSAQSGGDQLSIPQKRSNRPTRERQSREEK